MLSKESLTDESEEWSNVEPHLSLGHGNRAHPGPTQHSIQGEGLNPALDKGRPNIAKSGKLNTVISSNVQCGIGALTSAGNNNYVRNALSVDKIRF